MMKDLLRILGSAAIIAGIALYFIPTTEEITSEKALQEEIVTLKEKITSSEELIATLQASIATNEDKAQEEQPKVEAPESKQEDNVAKEQESVESTSDNKPNSPTKEFSIKPGADSIQVSQELQDAKIIKDAAQFQTDLETEDRSANIQIGNYELSPAMTHKEIIKIITAK